MIYKPYDPVNPDWLYTRFLPSNLEEITNDFRRLHRLLNSSSNAFNANYFNASKTEVFSECPTVVDWMGRLGILEKFDRALLSRQRIDKNNPHIDVSWDGNGVLHSVNFPIDNCAGTYTCFYKFPEDEEHKIEYQSEDSRHGSYPLNLKNWIEIGRAELTTPMVVNPTVLHRADSNTPMRVIAALRFSPQLTCEDIQKMCGLFDLH